MLRRAFLRSVNNSCNLNSARLAAVAAKSTLSELRRLGVYTRVSLPNVAHQMHKQRSPPWSTHTPQPTVQDARRGESKNSPNTFKETMTLPAKAQRKAASTRTWQASNNPSSTPFHRRTVRSIEHTSIGFQWVFKIKADGSKKGRVVVLEWGQVPGRDCGETFAPICRLWSIRIGSKR